MGLRASRLCLRVRLEHRLLNEDFLLRKGHAKAVAAPLVARSRDPVLPACPARLLDLSPQPPRLHRTGARLRRALLHGTLRFAEDVVFPPAVQTLGIHARLWGRAPGEVSLGGAPALRRLARNRFPRRHRLRIVRSGQRSGAWVRVRSSRSGGPADDLAQCEHDLGLAERVESNALATLLARIGDYSYSIYLVHFPIIVLALYRPFSGTVLKTATSRRPPGWRS